MDWFCRQFWDNSVQVVLHIINQEAPEILSRNNKNIYDSVSSMSLRLFEGDWSALITHLPF